MTKRLLGLLLVVLATIIVVPSFVTKTKAADVGEYDIGDAITYAEKNWNNGRGLCAQFVSECLNYGGVDAYAMRVVDLYNELLAKEYGTSYKLTLTNGKSGSIRMSDNEGKVKKGDPIFFVCNVCGEFEHVVLCNGANSDGYVQDYAHNKAHNGKKRTYTYGHCGSDNWTIYSISIDNGDTLKTPEVKSITGNAKGVEVKWDEVKFADSYNVYRKQPGGKWTTFKGVKGTSYTDTTAQNGKTYIYTVRACNEKTMSGFKPSAEFKFVDKIKFTSISATTKGVKLQWSQNTAATSYYLYRSVDGGKWARYATIKGNTKTTYTDTKVESGKTYRYRVRGVSGSSVGAYDSTGVGISYLKTPALKSIQNTKDGISVKWNSVQGATGYRVYRRAEADKGWTYLGVIKGTTYNDKKVQNEVVYTYTVRAVLKNSLSAFESGITLKHIKTPEITSIVSVEKGLSLEWETVEGVSGYYLYRKAPGEKSWTKIATVRNGNEYVDKNVEDGVEYTYTVKAYFDKTVSAYNKDGVTHKFLRKNENEFDYVDSDDNSDDID